MMDDLEDKMEQFNARENNSKKQASINTRLLFNDSPNYREPC